MKKILTALFIIIMINSNAQLSSPCGKDPIYRQFDFWIGEWDVFGPKGNKAGDSKISLILDSYIILEEWTSNAKAGTFGYKGKSFNTYNSQRKQWQQMWVDNVGGGTQYVYGKFESNKIVFQTDPQPFKKDSTMIQRLTFFALEKDKVRQLGEQSKDNGSTWTVQYDLEYRRKKQ